jgi:hypothetical protein
MSSSNVPVVLLATGFTLIVITELLRTRIEVIKKRKLGAKERAHALLKKVIVKKTGRIRSIVYTRHAVEYETFRKRYNGRLIVASPTGPHVVVKSKRKYINENRYVRCNICHGYTKSLSTLAHACVHCIDYICFHNIRIVCNDRVSAMRRLFLRLSSLTYDDLSSCDNLQKTTLKNIQVRCRCKKCHMLRKNTYRQQCLLVIGVLDIVKLVEEYIR